MAIDEKAGTNTATSTRALSREHRKWLRQRAYTLMSISLFLSAWGIAATFFINPLLLPTPALVGETMLDMALSGELFRHVWASLRRVLIGYLNGSFWAILIGFVVGRIVIARGLIMPIVNLVRFISPVALVPVMIIWFGIGELPKVLLVGYTSFVTILFTTILGVSSTPESRKWAAQSMGARELEVLRYVVLPSAVPSVLTGLRIGLGSCYISVVAAELIAGDVGIGFLIMQSRQTMMVEVTFVGLVMLGIVGFWSDVAFRKLVKRFAWQYMGTEDQREANE